MPTFTAPLLIKDTNNSLGTVIGPPGNMAMIPDTAGIILASSVFLHGVPGIEAGPQRITLQGEPGIFEVRGDDGSGIRMEAGGLFYVTDSNGARRIELDPGGTVKVTDGSGDYSVTVAGGRIEVANTNPGALARLVLDASGTLTLEDAFGQTAQYGASGWTVRGSAGCNVLGGNLAVDHDVNVDRDVNVGRHLKVGGNVIATGDIFLPGADCAEQFDVRSDATLEPGTVMVIEESGKLEASCAPYDRRVAGVVSGAGTHRPGIVLDSAGTADGRVPLALIGKVYCKATAALAPIAVGDLLTTSDVRGHAMRVDDPAKATGAILGKALQALGSGTGLIAILATLQ